jgi:hypothetical protein
MNSKNINRKWIKEDELPEGSPSSAAGWNIILDDLEKQMPEGEQLITVIQEKDNVRTDSVNSAKIDGITNTARRLSILILLIFVPLATWYSIIHFRQKRTHVISTGNFSARHDIAKKTPSFPKTIPSSSAELPIHAADNPTVASKGNKDFKNNSVLENLKKHITGNPSVMKSGKNTNPNSRTDHLLTYFVPIVRSPHRIKWNKYRNRKNDFGGVNDYGKIAVENTIKTSVTGKLLKKRNSGLSLQLVKDARVWKINGNLQLPVTENQNAQHQDTAIRISVGLAWSLPIPFSASTNYFSGPRGTLAPYWYALPSLWASIYPDEKNAFAVEIDPFETAMLNPKSSAHMDSANYHLITTYLNKIFGLSLRLGYEHDIWKNWWAGFGLQVDWWESGVADFRPNQQTEWIKISRSQVFLDASLMYKAPKWEAGIRAGIAFIGLSDSSAPNNLFNAGLFFRLPIFKFLTKH